MSNPLNPQNLVPALPLPPGQESNFVDPPSLFLFGVIDAVVCVAVSSILFGVRIYGRAIIQREWILEDYMACFSYAGFVVYIALFQDVMNKHGGIHQWDLTVPQVQEILYLFNIIAIIYGPIILLTKYTVLLMYSRVFSPRRWSPLNVMIGLAMIISTLFYFAITIVKIFQCTPRERIWDTTVSGTCVDGGMVLSVSGLFNTISDLLILLIPMNAVWKMNASSKKKGQIMAVFGVGLIAPVFNAIGVYYRFATSGSKDTSYNSPLILLWGTAEVTVGVICVCLPYCQTIYRHIESRGRKASVMSKSGDRREPRLAPRHSRFATSDSDHDLVELNRDSYDYGHGPVHAITTDIKGGMMSPQIRRSPSIHGSEMESEGSHMEKSMPEDGIMRTVRIEQSNV